MWSQETVKVVPRGRELVNSVPPSPLHHNFPDKKAGYGLLDEVSNMGLTVPFSLPVKPSPR